MSSPPASDTDRELARLLHDLRDALTTISGHSYLARRHLQRDDPIDAESCMEHLVAIADAVERACQRITAHDDGPVARLDGDLRGIEPLAHHGQQLLHVEGLEQHRDVERGDVGFDLPDLGQRGGTDDDRQTRGRGLRPQ